MNDATARLQRQLSFPPIAKRVLALVARCVDATQGDTLEARRVVAKRLRRVARRQAERVRFMGTPTTMAWWAADCMAAELPAIHWDWLAWYWVNRHTEAGAPPPEDGPDDVRTVAAYLANAAVLVSRAAAGNEPRHVLERRVAVLDLELARWRDAERAARAAEATP